ncbi:hypothetical protein, partial [Methylosinus sp. 3S-1]|uniref:hypothetical protein n=2 Tax=Methylocystaceae TaxID=31993 RepID=UPI000A535A82
ARAQIASLTEEKAKALSAAAAAQSELEAARKPNADGAQAQEHIRVLMEERNRLTADFARISAAAEAVAHELAAAREHIAGLTELRDRSGAESAEIRAWAENVLAHANRLHERLQQLDKESLTAFIRRRYLRRG